MNILEKSKQGKKQSLTIPYEQWNQYPYPDRVRGFNYNFLDRSIYDIIQTVYACVRIIAPVRLDQHNDEMRHVPISHFSFADQDYLAQWHKKPDMHKHLNDSNDEQGQGLVVISPDSNRKRISITHLTAQVVARMFLR